MTTVKYPNVNIRLSHVDGNAFAIMAAVSRGLRSNGVPKEQIDLYKEESMRSDYNNVLQTAMRWVEVS